MSSATTAAPSGGEGTEGIPLQRHTKLGLPMHDVNTREGSMTLEVILLEFWLQCTGLRCN